MYKENQEISNVKIKKNNAFLFGFKFIIFLSINILVSLKENYLLAQIVPDKTLGAESSIVNQDVIINNSPSHLVKGGAIRDINLFHSFQEFNVNEGKAVYFDNPSGVENILNRVTGNNSSSIFGKLGVLGNANLFLINPNGIVFGPNSSLDVNGSFLATTADSVVLTDKTLYSATNSEVQPLLSINVPIGLQFGEAAKSIAHQSNSNSFKVGSGQTIAFLGGNILLEGGVIVANELNASGGRIELGSVAENELVNLEFVEDGLVFGYKNVQNFKDIILSQQSRIEATGIGGGEISLTGKQVRLTEASQVLAVNVGSQPGRDLKITASDYVELSGSGIILLKLPSGEILEVPISSSLSTDTLSTGKAGNILVKTKSFLIQDSSRITTRTFGENRFRQPEITGQGGNINLIVSESLEINDNSLVSTESQALGKNAGDLKISSGQLIISNNSEIRVSATGTGEAGSLTIDATNITLNEGTFTATTKVGDQGNITISNAETLLLRNNSKIITDATIEATGGKITITADAIAGLENSDITANAEQGRGGKITINASRGVIGLEVREQQNPNTSDITAISELAPEFNGEIIFNAPDIDPLNGLIELPTVPLDAEAIFAQNLCKFEDGKIAKGSSFIITGKGGITPTSKNPLGDRDRVVNWANRDDLKVSKNGVVGVLQGSAPETLKTSDRVIEQAQGWIVTADGSVWLTAHNPEATPQSSSLVHPDCRSRVQVK